MRKKGGFLSGLQGWIGGWIEGAWSFALLVLLFSPCVMGMVIAVALAPGINRNSDNILKEGEVYLHWTFRLLSEYASVLFIFLFFFVVVAYFAIANLSRAAGHAAVLVAKAYLPAPQGQLPAPQVTYNVAAPSQEVQAMPVLGAPIGNQGRPALPAPQSPVDRIAKVIKGLKLEAGVTELAVGPQVVTYGLTPEFKKSGSLTTVSDLTSKSDDIALALKAESVRFYLHDGYLALEVPRKKRETVSLFELLETGSFRNSKASVPLAFGKDTFGNWVVGDLAELPHLLVGSTTGGGKSVTLNGILCGLLSRFGSNELILKLIDPKRGVEFSTFAEFGELIIEVEDFPPLLDKLIVEMEDRYEFLSKAGKKKIAHYNESAEVPMPYIVVVIDEYGDIVLSEDIEKQMIKLAQKGRATGIHFILATQRPDKDIVTGLIKANFPGRLALKVTDKTNAKIVLGTNGAEALAGRGDALYKDEENFIRRLQIGYASDKEIERFLGSEPVRNRWGLAPNQFGVNTEPVSEPVENQPRSSAEPARTTSEPVENYLRTSREPASPQEEIENLTMMGESKFEIAKYIAEKYPRLSANSIQRMVGMTRSEAQRAVREVRGSKQKPKVYVNGHGKEASYA